MRIFVCCLLLTFISMTSMFAAPLAEKGTLDLRATDLADSGPIDVRGSWHFYWKAFLEPEELESHVPLLIQTPATWGSQSLGIKDHGYGTYHIKMVLSGNDVGRMLGLFIPSIASAYQLYINGEKVASAGEIGASLKEVTPATRSQTIYFIPNNQEVDLVAHVSNFSQRKGGIWEDFILGTAEQIAKEREHRMLYQGSIAAGLLLITFFLFVFYTFWADKATLYFGLACLSLFLRAIFVGDMFAIQIVTNVPWEIVMKIKYLSALWGIGLMVIYFFYLHQNIVRRSIIFSLVFIIGIISIPIVIWPARVYTEWMVYYQLAFLSLVVYIFYGLVRAALYRRSGSVVNVAAGLVFMGMGIIDIVYDRNHYESTNLVIIGLSLFVITQIFILSQKFASAFQEVERLKHNLENMNENLEEVVVKRTAALRESNEKLENSERARKDLLSNITHELGNPLTSILGYLRRLKDGVPKDMEARHIHIAYQKALRLEQVTDDLRQLVKLENGQLAFEMQLMELSQFYDELRLVYDWDLLERQVNFQWNEPMKGNCMVHVDIHRIEQVFTNIINNAIEHTEPNDQITVIGRYFSYANVCVIAIRDTGTGIYKEDQAQLFERFFRAERVDKERREGSGLGLTISKAIIEAHSGKIGVRSKYGEGSTFYFILPITEGALL